MSDSEIENDLETKETTENIMELEALIALKNKEIEELKETEDKLKVEKDWQTNLAKLKASYEKEMAEGTQFLLKFDRTDDKKFNADNEDNERPKNWYGHHKAKGRWKQKQYFQRR